MTATVLEEAAAPTLAKIEELRKGTHGAPSEMLRVLPAILFDKGLSVSVWKERCGLRDNSVAVVFNLQVDSTPRAFIEGVRIEIGTRLLRETELRIYRIADMLGFSGVPVFSKAFVRVKGVRPSRYRKAAKEDRSGKQADVEGVLELGAVGRLAVQIGRLESTTPKRQVRLAKAIVKTIERERKRRAA